MNFRPREGANEAVQRVGNHTAFERYVDALEATSVGFTCYAAVVLLFSTATVQRRYLALSRPIERVCGTVMLAFGLTMLLLGA